MIRLFGPHGSYAHYVSPASIARISEAGDSSQWHGIRSFVHLVDGTVLESDQTAEAISAAMDERPSERDEALMSMVLSAMEHHREQTRPIDRTNLAITALRLRLRRPLVEDHQGSGHERG